jgi:MoxR-like ATPase
VAAVNNRDFVLPDDIKQIAAPVFAHRLILTGAERIKKNAAEDIVREILNKTTVPAENHLYGR